jgi:hypothetical protein
MGAGGVGANVGDNANAERGVATNFSWSKLFPLNDAAKIISPN